VTWVHVSDPPEKHNFELLQKLVLSNNGEILRPKTIARPTLDCLFSNPVLEKVIYKIFNLNEYGAVVGAFNVCKKRKR
jgi:Raffinose synthase or seed imbibition protein Sip1